MKKGISLIVLSITILVMAILAATAIIALEDSGIIGRSKNTVNKQNQQEEYTRLQVIKNGILTSNLGTITVAEYVEKLRNDGIIENRTHTDVDGSVIVKTKNGLDVYIKQDGESNIKISFEPLFTTLGMLINSAADYGKKVNYEANGVTDWKVFYKQTIEGEEYVYLIASESLAYDKMPRNIPNLTVNSKEVTIANNEKRTLAIIYWENMPTGTAVIQNKSLWMANWKNYTAYGNGIGSSYFLDETYWSNFKNTTANYASYVKGAIGTPTLEMFVASYNAKREATGDTITYPKKLELVTSTFGYYMTDALTGASEDTMYEQNIGTEDSLYVWDTVATYSCVWLASPCNFASGYLFRTYYSGLLERNGYANTINGVRPVVCINANVPAVLDTNGNFVI